MNTQQNQLLPEEVILAECWLMMVSILLTTIQVCTYLPREPSSSDPKTIGPQHML